MRARDADARRSSRCRAVAAARPSAGGCAGRTRGFGASRDETPRQSVYCDVPTNWSDLSKPCAARSLGSARGDAVEEGRSQRRGSGRGARAEPEGAAAALERLVRVVLALERKHLLEARPAEASGPIGRRLDRVKVEGNVGLGRAVERRAVGRARKAVEAVGREVGVARRELRRRPGGGRRAVLGKDAAEDGEELGRGMDGQFGGRGTGVRARRGAGQRGSGTETHLVRHHALVVEEHSGRGRVCERKRARAVQQGAGDDSRSAREATWSSSRRQRAVGWL